MMQELRCENGEKQIMSKNMRKCTKMRYLLNYAGRSEKRWKKRNHIVAIFWRDWLQLILLLFLPYPHTGYTLNSKPFSSINPFLFSLLAPTLVGSLAPWPSARFSSHCHFHYVAHFHLVHLRQWLWINLHRLQMLGRLYTGTLNLPTHLHSVFTQYAKSGNYYY